MPSLDQIRAAAGAGAPLAGAAPVASLPRDRDEIHTILRGAQTVVVVAAPHSRSAIASPNLQVAQYDTRHAYDAVARASHALALWLEEGGCRAVAVPAFLPIDMSPGKNGMRGVLDLREAAVRAGLGGHGECGLLVTARFGSAVRIGAVLTDAELETTVEPAPNPCTGCGRCVQACPVNALHGAGKIDKKACGDRIFATGYRAWRGFLAELAGSDREGREELLKSQLSLDLWQNFMTGVYYSCWACQAACPVGGAVGADGVPRVEVAPNTTRAAP